MFTLADQEQAYRRALRSERDEGRSEGLDEGRKEGEQEGRKMGEKEGRIKGRVEGENLFAALVTKLFSSGRASEVERAASDEAYRKKLLEEFKMV